MKILLISATVNEIQPIIEHFRVSFTSNNCLNISTHDHNFDILIMGVSVPKTIFALTRWLENNNHYDLCINLGICGAFDPNIPLGALGLVTYDRFGDIGVELADESFLDLFEGNVEAHSFPFDAEGWLASTYLKRIDFVAHYWKGVTVNKVTGSHRSIAFITEKHKVDIETMEGAAVFFVCSHYNLPCIQMRAVSNHVEPRDKSKWNISLAISNLFVGYEQLLKVL